MEGDTGRATLADEKTVHDGSEGSDLTPVADQLAAIAEQLRAGDLGAVLNSTAGLNEASQNVGAHTSSELPRAANSSQSGKVHGDLTVRRKHFAEMARQTYDFRRKRGSIFGDPELFGEPAWDILLDLYVAHVDNKRVSVSSACIGSAAPATTGLRWLGILSEHGLVTRENDPEDQRRVLVRLTEIGLAAMDRYFSDASVRGAPA